MVIEQTTKHTEVTRFGTPCAKVPVDLVLQEPLVLVDRLAVGSVPCLRKQEKAKGPIVPGADALADLDALIYCQGASTD